MTPGASLIAGKSVQGCFSTEKIILNRRKVCGGMNFHGGNHLNLQESLCRDAFPRKKSSLIAGKSVQGCFSTEEIILNRRKVCAGMLFHRKMHPCMEKLLFQDALVVWKSISARQKANFKMLRRTERPEQSEQPAVRTAGTTSAIRKSSTASHSINYRNGKRLCQHSSTRH